MHTQNLGLFVQFYCIRFFVCFGPGTVSTSLKTESALKINCTIGQLNTHRCAFDPCVTSVSNDAPRVIRGGSFRDNAAACDSNARASALPTDKGYAIRLVAFP